MTRTSAPASAGPLRGIAVGIKDIMDTADFPTEMGSSIYKGFRSRGDAAVVMALKAAGATIVGKTTTTAFASNDPTATLNPRNNAHTPGGSSAGSAAAVGAGMIPLALGTQTGGSVIRPASFCGCAAIKPTYRLLPTVGVKCYSWTLDTVGLFAAGVRDVAHGLSAMTGRDELLLQASVPTPRIGVVTQDFAGAPEAEGAEALQIAAKAAERAGATVRTLAMPEIFAEAWRKHPTVQQFEAHQALAWEYREHYDEMAPNLRGRLDESKGMPPADYDEAMRDRVQARSALATDFRRGRRAAGHLGAGRGAQGLGLDRRRPLQPAVDADGNALRQHSRAHRRRRICRSACRSSRAMARMRRRWRRRGSSSRRWRGSRTTSARSCSRCRPASRLMFSRCA